MEGDGAAYYGKVSKTHSGLECQAWNVQTHHKHSFGRLGDHNYCRNPDRDWTLVLNNQWEEVGDMHGQKVHSL